MSTEFWSKYQLILDLHTCINQHTHWHLSCLLSDKHAAETWPINFTDTRSTLLSLGQLLLLSSILWIQLLTYFFWPLESLLSCPLWVGGLETVVIPEKQCLTILLNVQQSTDTPLTLDWNAADCWWQHSNWGVGQVSTNRSNWWSSNLINMTSEYWPM